MKLMKLKANTGFTLLETMIVVAITMILSATMLGYNRSSEKQIVLYRDQAIIVGLVNRARSLALQKFNVENACAFGVHFDKTANKFIIFADKKISGECKNSSGVYQLNGVYNGGEELAGEKSIFFLDERNGQAGGRLIFRSLSGGQSATAKADIIFIPPELETKTNPSGMAFVVKTEAVGGSICSQLEIGAGGQITEGDCN